MATMRRSAYLSIVLLTWSISLAQATSDTVFRCSYDIALELNGESHAVRSQASVRSGSYIPVRLQNTEVQIHITESTEESVSVRVSVRDVGARMQPEETVTEHEFPASLLGPTEISWREGTISVEVALAVVKLR